MKLNICHLYPDMLGLYGDRGNLFCLRRRLEWRGIEAEITEVPLGVQEDLSRFDLIFLGGGQETDPAPLLEALTGPMGESLHAAVEQDKVLLAVGSGFQLLGRSFRTRDGRDIPLLGILDFTTAEQPERMTGDCLFDCLPGSGIGTVVGFENHCGATTLGDGVEPLGRVIKGFGNNGADGTEGIHARNVFGTYSHGPLLPKNPALCDHILLTALRLHHPDAELAPLDDAAEQTAHDYMRRRLEQA